MKKHLSFDEFEHEFNRKHQRFTEREEGAIPLRARGTRRDFEDYQERRERERARKRKMKQLSRGE